jgi:hypothetical protein
MPWIDNFSWFTIFRWIGLNLGVELWNCITVYSLGKISRQFNDSTVQHAVKPIDIKIAPAYDLSTGK